MIKRTLVFTNPVYLSKRNNQLVIEFPEKCQDKAQPVSVPIEDIGVVLLEHKQITITHSCIAALVENNAALITCDDKHMPSGLLLPLEGNHIQSERFRKQIEASAPLKKQLWQQTVQAKITNQAALLRLSGVDTKNMEYWSASVRSGDPDNYEGRAAAFYWKSILGSDVNRHRFGSAPNNLLNYGYAILRAIVARNLVSSGLLPTFGIHHRNKYNAFCLADDIMEPYRPFIDKLVINIVEDEEEIEELNWPLKERLIQIAEEDVVFGKDKSPLLVGVSRTTASLAKCFEGTIRKISYPSFS